MSGDTYPRTGDREVDQWLRMVFKGVPKEAATWLDTPLLDLDGLTPRQAIEEGDAERISEFLATFFTGGFI